MATTLQSTIPESKYTYQVAMGRSHNVTQYKNRLKKISFDLGEYPELNIKILESNILKLIF